GAEELDAVCARRTIEGSRDFGVAAGGIRRGDDREVLRVVGASVAITQIVWINEPRPIIKVDSQSAVVEAVVAVNAVPQHSFVKGRAGGGAFNEAATVLQVVGDEVAFLDTIGEEMLRAANQIAARAVNQNAVAAIAKDSRQTGIGADPVVLN